MSFSTSGWTRGTTFWSTKRLNASTTRCAILLRSSARGFRVCGKDLFPNAAAACDQGGGEEAKNEKGRSCKSLGKAQ